MLWVHNSHHTGLRMTFGADLFHTHAWVMVLLEADHTTEEQLRRTLCLHSSASSGMNSDRSRAVIASKELPGRARRLQKEAAFLIRIRIQHRYLGGPCKGGGGF